MSEVLDVSKDVECLSSEFLIGVVNVEDNSLVSVKDVLVSQVCSYIFLLCHSYEYDHEPWTPD